MGRRLKLVLRASAWLQQITTTTGCSSYLKNKTYHRHCAEEETFVMTEEKSNKIRFRHGFRSQAAELELELYLWSREWRRTPAKIMSTNMASTVVSFDCTAKIYIEGRYSKEHSCHVSLETSNSETYLYIEGHGVRARRIKVRKAKSALHTEPT